MSKHICPNCGQPVTRRQPTNQYSVTRAQWGNAPDVDFSLAEYLTPARAAGVGSDVAVPLLQSAVSGVVTGLLSAWPVFYFGWPWFIPFLVTVAVFAGAWFKLLADHRKSLWNSERIEGQPQTQAPEISQYSVRLEVNDDGNLKYVDFPIDIDSLQTMARAIVNGRSFSIGEWTGKGRLLTRTQFETLRTWLFNNDYADWTNETNHAQGVTFNSKGNAFWRGLAG